MLHGTRKPCESSVSGFFLSVRDRPDFGRKQQNVYRMSTGFDFSTGSGSRTAVRITTCRLSIAVILPEKYAGEGKLSPPGVHLPLTMYRGWGGHPPYRTSSGLSEQQPGLATPLPAAVTRGGHAPIPPLKNSCVACPVLRRKQPGLAGSRPPHRPEGASDDVGNTPGSSLPGQLCRVCKTDGKFPLC